MRVPRVVLLLTLLLFLACAVTVKAFEKLDFEIFELWDEVKKQDGVTDWYELLGVSKKATIREINKAYRKHSMKYHPDKNLLAATNPSIGKKFARLGSVVNILRDKHSRDRYDFYLKNGVPMWRGTGYLYHRWRPGLGVVLIGLLLFVSGMQYLYMYLSYLRAQERIKAFDRDMAELERERRALTDRRGGTLSAKDQRAMEEEQAELQARFAGNGINPWLVPPPDWTGVLAIRLAYAAMNAVRTRVLGYEPLVPRYVATAAELAHEAQSRQQGSSEDERADLRRVVAEGQNVIAEKLGPDDAEDLAKPAPKIPSAKSLKNKSRKRRTPKV
ncbi:hypothetical protein EV182_000067 [Spiromyces aspiralis]|uniref:Uncharacterized protein n=1 Tax=Spiromyces aspiralis TaxID=68401 RepID=A0ACC1HYR5_9FUNG|nr:hypothetical protein EV182_000067 [Spiromyces aspiralis]